MELYDLFMNGDDEAFNEIMYRYRRPVISFIYRFVRQIDVAEDLAQDTFVYVLMRRNKGNVSIISLKSYLFLIAKCRAINYLKRKRNVKNVAIEDMSNLRDEFDLAEELLREESKAELYLALGKLKKEYQLVIYLRDIQNFQYKEISEILSITLAKTKILIYRARKALAKVLERGDCDVK